MDKSEDYILSKTLCNPTCRLVVESLEARVTLEQSLELTWHGPVEECRKLVGLLTTDVLSQLRPVGIEDHEEIYQVKSGGATITVYVRGPLQQVPGLFKALLRFGGVSYFDKSVKDRVRHR